MVIPRSEVTGNAATEGGGLHLGYVGPTIVDSTVAGNTAGDTGGVDAVGLTLTDSTIADNIETGAGATTGVELDAQALVLNHVTVRGGEGSGAAVDSQDLTAKAMVVAAGLADLACAVVDPTVTQGANADDDASCEFLGGTDQSDVATLGLGTLALRGGTTRTIGLTITSTLLDTQANASCGLPNPDQRGVARAQGTACDTGAFEARFRPDLLLRRSDQPGFTGSNFYTLNSSLQFVQAPVARAATVNFVARIQNDGERPERIKVIGGGGGYGVAVFNRFGQPVTAAAFAGTYRTPLLDPGGFDTLTLRVRTDALVPPGSSTVVQVFTLSTNPSSAPGATRDLGEVRANLV